MSRWLSFLGFVACIGIAAYIYLKPAAPTEEAATEGKKELGKILSRPAPPKPAAPEVEVHQNLPTGSPLQMGEKTRPIAPPPVNAPKAYESDPDMYRPVVPPPSGGAPSNIPAPELAPPGYSEGPAGGGGFRPPPPEDGDYQNYEPPPVEDFRPPPMPDPPQSNSEFDNPEGPPSMEDRPSDDVIYDGI